MLSLTFLDGGICAGGLKASRSTTGEVALEHTLTSLLGRRVRGGLLGLARSGDRSFSSCSSRWWEAKSLNSLISVSISINRFLTFTNSRLAVRYSSSVPIASPLCWLELLTTIILSLA